jgi:hypothetical protein
MKQHELLLLWPFGQEAECRHYAGRIPRSHERAISYAISETFVPAPLWARTVYGFSMCTRAKCGRHSLWNLLNIQLAD